MITAAKLHLIYSLLLAHLFSLAPSDEKAIRKHWDCDPYMSRMVQWPELSIDEVLQRAAQIDPLRCGPEEWERYMQDTVARLPKPLKICSMPSEWEKLSAANELSRLFDLEGVPGFYRRREPLPGPQATDEQAMLSEFGPWRINLNYRKGLLVPYESGGYIVGIKIYRSVSDRNPLLLTSRNMPGGAKAVALRESAAA